MVQIDALVSECLGYLFVLDPPVVERVKGAVVLVGSPRDAELRLRHHLELLPTLVDDLLEMDGNPAALHVLVFAGIVNEDGQLLRPELKYIFKFGIV